MTVNQRPRHFVLAAGGTGGHMVPAAALAAELTRRGHRVALVSDERGVRFPGLFEGIQTHVLPAGRFTGGPLGWAKATRSMWRGRMMARELYRTFKPAAVIGFGGYPALPALLAAFANRIPTAVHEQNAVLGRVNRLVARRVDAIATSSEPTERLASGLLAKTHLVGNPVREAVLALRARPYPLLEEDGIFRVLVTGGSQGASILSQVVPDGLAMLPVTFRRRLQVTHQARIEDIDAVRAQYAEHHIPAELATYLPDMPEQLAWAHLVIARAGASTIAELTAAGRPAILVPLPGATDDHQTVNAREITRAGGARTIRQGDFTAVELAKQMQKLGLDPAALQNAAGRARSCGRPNAASDLADLVESLDAPVSRLPVGRPSKPKVQFA
ncbi:MULTISPECIES: undecaprenyldiphospho-muramoylpentapeptide beta-N-acetylglucosaminyltransferase [Sphingomonas]|jgi:UDP-N-acetylglucosamine--N-acetylmuramyl-(pentapeptide) pyrophosphoryl-undecaprenol N-acetylglucosamine transferase|uniref:UDP-N-acetylglucosamine--N-acetylmuramyl-(pentapeptide) pyrophosphoryl-undecaprenol N-acetylglucosamine transferase n=2 Tax=Alphaproteobacteria TaxID=28211 RepID=A0A2T4YR11_9SPHN|nr:MULTISPECIES: undecaprenyldiphospho-muramoylpentapeptide beta-N-acetylglucosaminyltransferase [Sphingomonas]KQM99667.1 UDP-N-acetylglucosamine--N-acetylmuramyl-(pentapeptide) pyrophosphoryl-undecaprenol N-acetylglucosamine transferase [Sphingomonas sp. Leaf226]KQN14508.1 UDP-N-acetylglucosamine--N-acetylmuramyl-(pentapeptide) pyrophosphoryl-undecaprenol N-acetylglucosamine transferase [Sphingomonas sp. Leaf30]MBB3585615.1 UDP-N-acetylglucosamine--N-acetylmuramyl-(pentapeptide) pyrophosphoryl-